MSSIASPIEEIKALRITPLGKLPNGRSLKVVKAARSGSTVVLVTDKGELFSNAIRDRCHYSFGLYPFTTPLMKTLAAAGVISREGMKEHLRLAAKFDKDRDRRYSAKVFKRAAGEAGIALTKSQSRKVEEALRDED